MLPTVFAEAGFDIGGATGIDYMGKQAPPRNLVLPRVEAVVDGMERSEEEYDDDDLGYGEVSEGADDQGGRADKATREDHDLEDETEEEESLPATQPAGKQPAAKKLRFTVMEDREVPTDSPERQQYRDDGG